MRTGCLRPPKKSYVLNAGKETMKPRRVILISLLMFVALLSAGSAGAASGSMKDALKDQASYIAPFCTDYYNWLNSKTSNPCQDSEGHGLGLIPAPVEAVRFLGSGSLGNPGKPCIGRIYLESG